MVFWADYALGEISVSPLYFLIVAYSSWQFNTLTAGVLAALLAALGRMIADWHSGTVYSSDWILYENALMRLIVFMATAYALMAYRRTLEAHRRRIESLRKMLPICHCCGSVRGPDGRWLPFDGLSRSPFPEVHECPDCAARPENPRHD